MLHQDFPWGTDNLNFTVKCWWRTWFFLFTQHGALTRAKASRACFERSRTVASACLICWRWKSFSSHKLIGALIRLQRKLKTCIKKWWWISKREGLSGKPWCCSQWVSWQFFSPTFPHQGCKLGTASLCIWCWCLQGTEQPSASRLRDRDLLAGLPSPVTPQHWLYHGGLNSTLSSSCFKWLKCWVLGFLLYSKRPGASILSVNHFRSPLGEVFCIWQTCRV